MSLRSACVLWFGSLVLGHCIGTGQWATAAALCLLNALQLVIQVRRGVRW